MSEITPSHPTVDIASIYSLTDSSTWLWRCFTSTVSHIPVFPINCLHIPVFPINRRRWRCFTNRLPHPRFPNQLSTVMVFHSTVSHNLVFPSNPRQRRRCLPYPLFYSTVRAFCPTVSHNLVYSSNRRQCQRCLPTWFSHSMAAFPPYCLFLHFVTTTASSPRTIDNSSFFSLIKSLARQQGVSPHPSCSFHSIHPLLHRQHRRRCLPIWISHLTQRHFIPTISLFHPSCLLSHSIGDNGVFSLTETPTQRWGCYIPPVSLLSH